MSPETGTATILPPLPLAVDESNALAGEGTLSAALAVARWRFVYCSHGTIPATDWHEHTHEYTQVGPDADDVWAIERIPDQFHDCILLLRRREPYLGTHTDNVRDMVTRNRVNDRRGNLNGRAKLTPDQVRDIRRRHSEGELTEHLAIAFGVDPRNIARILTGQAWTNV